MEPDLFVILHKKCDSTGSSLATVFADGRRKLVIFRLLLTIIFIIYAEADNKLTSLFLKGIV